MKHPGKWPWPRKPRPYHWSIQVLFLVVIASAIVAWALTQTSMKIWPPF